MLIAGIGAAVYFFIIAPSNLHINEITLVDTGTDYLTVQVDSGEKEGSFQVVCSDTYGNKFHQSFQAKTDLTFSGLVPGTVHRDRRAAERRNPDRQLHAHGNDARADGDSELHGNACLRDAGGAEPHHFGWTRPGSWTVSYAAEGQEAQTATFSGHSTVIAGLASGTEYTFTLQEPENTKLIGQTRRNVLYGSDRQHRPAAVRRDFELVGNLVLGYRRRRTRRAGPLPSRVPTTTPTRRSSPRRL